MGNIILNKKKENVLLLKKEISELRLQKEKDEERRLLSKHNLDDFVAKLIRDENINIAFLPDIVEKEIYVNTLSILLHLVEHVLTDTKVEFLGHEISISINPIKEKEEDIPSSPPVDEEEEDDLE
jgi:hypothetical protein